MPGYRKDTGPDPDPTEFLYVSDEQKEQDQSKSYDPQKSCWVPDEKEGFVEGEIQATKGDLITVCVGEEVKDWKKEMIELLNPPELEKCEDMSDLTVLNGPSIFHNVKSRYLSQLIYTYAGPSCVVINPCKRYPLYTNRVAKMYQGKKRNEMPPHLFGISEDAYTTMLQGRENQSLVITGESGAGKTENTKKVLAYFANVAAAASEVEEGEEDKPNIGEQIVQTNPIVEAFGNAKTVRNDNASRFVRFIRIHFQAEGKLAGVEMEVFMLEKARVIFQTPNDRSFHIFYQLMSEKIKEIAPLCMLSDEIFDYQYVSQGKVDADTVDDGEDMQYCHAAFDVLGFSETERANVYKVTAAVMQFGEMRFRKKGTDEAEPAGTEVGRTIGKLLGVEADDLYRCFLKPKVKVGEEFVEKNMTEEQCTQLVGSAAKTIYERLFKWLVTKCNTILKTGLERAYFIGVLDVPGFEIFDVNGFEQICINFCDEKLQQFYNQQIFLLEQEEYKKEAIEWTPVDFGMDLKACIELFEKQKTGLLSILDEECVTPEATDKSFAEKLNANHLGKTPVFVKPKPPKEGQAEAHFTIVHYAGTVSYNLTGWLEKNKDPLNDSLVDLLKNSSNELCASIFTEQQEPPQEAPTEDAEEKSEEPEPKPDPKAKTKAKPKPKATKPAVSIKTVTSGYKERMDRLLKTLKATRPHFIRCILPNEAKTPGVIDASMVLHQLTCNGVLEGIRMHRISFPIKISYKDFKNRYKIFASQEIAGITESKKAAKKCLEKADLEKDLYRLGKKKVFFRAGVLDTLDNIKEERKGLVVAWLQAWIRGFNTRKTYKEMEEKRLALVVVQRNLRKYIRIHTWKWLGLFEAIRPMLNITKIEDELKELEVKYTKSQEELEKETTLRRQLEVENLKLQEEKYDLMVTLDSTKGDLNEYIEKQAKLKSQKADLETQLEDTSDRLQKEEEARSTLTETRTKLRHEIDVLKIELEEIEIAMNKAEHAAAAKEQVILDLKEEINSQEELIKKVKKEKKHLQEVNQKTAEDNQCVEDKCTHLTLLKGNLEKHLEKLEGFLEHEKKIRSEAEKQKRKAESDLRLTQQTVTDLHKGRKELEQAIDRKNKEVSALVIKVEEEHQQVVRLMNQIKESEKRQGELEAEILQERQTRSTTETARIALSHEVSDLSNRLNEASAVATAQIEMNKNREAEVARLRNDLKEKSLHYESTLSQQQKKHHETMEGMAEQIDDLSRSRARVENERDSLKQELEAARNTIDRIIREGADLEQTSKDLKHQLHEVQTRYDDAVRTLSDLESTKKKLSSDNKSLGRQLEEAEAQVDVLSKLKMSLESELQDAKSASSEGRLMYTTLLEKYRNLEHDIGVLKEKLEEECDSKTNLQRLLSLASAETNKWRSKYETEGVTRTQELEAARQKLACRLEEAEVQIEQLHVKNAGLEKIKQRTAVELVHMQGELESTRALASAAEEKQKSVEKVIDEWKAKVDAITLELESSRKECRNYAAQNSRVNAAYKESLEQVASLRQEKESLASEIKTLMDQISNRSQALHNIQLSFKRLQGEKEELQADLEEAEIALEQEEIKVQRAQVELNQVRQEIERRVQEKDEEFEKTRNAYERSVDSIRASLETEVKDKAQAVYMRKKLEADIHQQEVALKRAKEANTDLQKAYERMRSENEDQQARLEDSERLASQQQEQLRVLERRIGSVMAELEEAHTLLEQADRSRRSVDVKLSEADDYIRKLTSENESLLASKERLEDELQNTQADFDEIVKEAKSSEEKAKRAAMDASRLADELRSEQENAQTQEKLRKGLEVSLRETQARMDDDSSSQKMSSATIAKMESRIKDLETRLEEESSRHSDAQKNLRRAERRVKELTVRAEEDKKNHEGMQDLVDKLQQKIKGYKRQMEEAEEIAALNLAKYRKAQQELEEFEENASISRKVTRMEAPQVVA